MLELERTTKLPLGLLLALVMAVIDSILLQLDRLVDLVLGLVDNRSANPSEAIVHLLKVLL